MRGYTRLLVRWSVRFRWHDAARWRSASFAGSIGSVRSLLPSGFIPAEDASRIICSPSSCRPARDWRTRAPPPTPSPADARACLRSRTSSSIGGSTCWARAAGARKATHGHQPGAKSRSASVPRPRSRIEIGRAKLDTVPDIRSWFLQRQRPAAVQLAFRRRRARRASRCRKPSCTSARCKRMPDASQRRLDGRRSTGPRCVVVPITDMRGRARRLDRRRMSEARARRHHRRHRRQPRQVQRRRPPDPDPRAAERERRGDRHLLESRCRCRPRRARRCRCRPWRRFAFGAGPDRDRPLRPHAARR